MIFRKCPFLNFYKRIRKINSLPKLAAFKSLFANNFTLRRKDYFFYSAGILKASIINKNILFWDFFYYFFFLLFSLLYGIISFIKAQCIPTGFFLSALLWPKRFI